MHVFVHVDMIVQCVIVKEMFCIVLFLTRIKQKGIPMKIRIMDASQQTKSSKERDGFIPLFMTCEDLKATKHLLWILSLNQISWVNVFGNLDRFCMAYQAMENRPIDIFLFGHIGQLG